jgi:hypothetical protein
VISPPIAFDMNSGRYRAHRNKDDLTHVGTPLSNLFRFNDPIRLARGTVIGHAILSNPHSEPVKANLEIKKAIDLALNIGTHQIPEKMLDVQYYAYDLATDTIGPTRLLMDNSVIINANENILAKIVLIKDFPITGVKSPDGDFWRKFTMEVGFNKLGDKNHIVEGLRLLSREPNVGTPSNEYDVPWGDNHNVRRRSAPRYGA